MQSGRLKIPVNRQDTSPSPAMIHATLAMAHGPPGGRLDRSRRNNDLTNTGLA